MTLLTHSFIAQHEADARTALGRPSAARVALYQWMRTARAIDELEQELVARGEAFFQVSSTGHEASAAFAPFLEPQDYLHCHYRDKALLLARGLPIAAFFDSLLCNGASHSAGRQMSAHLSSPPLHVLSLVGPVGNHALQAAGVAREIKEQATQPIVLCSMGDGTAQQGEVLEAIAEAVRWQLPVLFVIEDNGYAISTRTRGATFYSTPSGDASSFYGLPLHRVDGSDALACSPLFQQLVLKVRQTRGPALCLMQTERLSQHTNADDEGVYRSREELDRVRATSDPVRRLREALVAAGMACGELDVLDAAVDAEVRSEAEAALRREAPRTAWHAMPAPRAPQSDQLEYRGGAEGERLNMAAALRGLLAARLAEDPRVSLYGEDIDDPKGDVFGVTRGLGRQHPGRVVNSPLSESTIVGTSIGRALAGGRPVAFLQFADFLPLAFNQLATELATMSWRTLDGWRAPVVVMVPCGAYRPGLGPFHAATYEATIAHIPGLDVAFPSTAGDAAGMLRAAFAGERPTVFLYPKALLNDPSRSTTADLQQHYVPIGKARRVRQGDALTLVAWGNTVPLCEHAAQTLAQAGVQVDLIDLRWLAPWDREMVCESAGRTGRLLVVHEDNATAGFGAEVIATVSESVQPAVRCRRLARADTFVPCHFGNQLDVLPSYRTVLTTAAELCGLDIAWDEPQALEAGREVVRTIGSSPADQSVELVELNVKAGDRVHAGQVIASFEADKAIVDLASPADGVVDRIHLAPGERVPVDAPLMTLCVEHARRRQPVREEIRPACLTPRKAPAPAQGPATASGVATEVVLLDVAAVTGRARLHNAELLAHLPGFASAHGDGIFERTGIESRVVADPTQDAVNMATQAAEDVLASAGLSADDLDLVVCSTTTPLMISPSTACQVLHRLSPSAEVTAYDIQAACSGYLYALTIAWDFLKSRPDATVLVLTTETMRTVVNLEDADTSPLFGDAATATLLTTRRPGVQGLAVLERPVTAARGEDGGTLRVPLPRAGAGVHMDGRKIFVEAVRRMQSMLEAACTQSGVRVHDLDLIIPHQANGRIIEAMRSRLKLEAHRVLNDLRYHGNTSSSSIPLALASVLHAPPSQRPRSIGLCSFGAGFTFGGAVLKMASQERSGLPETQRT